MKRYEGFAPHKMGHYEDLTPGGYVLKIMKAEDVEFENGPCLKLSFDIAEGEKQDFFAKDYRQNPFENRKWRGIHYLNQPKGDGSKNDGWAINSMNNFAGVLEESNPGFTWDWVPIEKGDYSQFAGKLMGGLFGKVEWKWDGKNGWKTKLRFIVPAEDVRQGDFEIPESKPLNNSPFAASTAELADSLTDDDLPF